jgi:hypothetical protein
VGISRGSYPTMMAGAFDERVAVVLPNQGIQSYRNEEHAANTGNCVICSGSINGNSNVRSATFTGGAAVTPLGAQVAIHGNLAKLPYDWNIIMGLMAPRAFYNWESLIWDKSSPRGQTQAFHAGQPVWTALGVTPSSRTQIRYTDIISVSGGNSHEMTYTHWSAQIDFCEYVYHGTALPADNTFPAGAPIVSGSLSEWSRTNNASIPRGSPVFGGLPQAYNWSTPTLT